MAVFLKRIYPTIEKFVEDLALRTNVTSVGLFGSWARYEASVVSDVDLLVVDGSDVEFEFRELEEYEGLLMDINRIPWSWVGEVVLPDIDHRLHETIILHDPSGVLKRARGFVEDCYRTRGRVEVRTEGYLTDADMYLSRASSAYTRRDMETASLFADLSLTPIAQILMDVAGVPITRGAFIWNLRRAGEKLRMMEVYRRFVNMVRLSGLERGDVSRSLSRLDDAWHRISDFVVDSGDVVDGLHDRLRREIMYLTDPAMIGCILGRTREMLEGNNLVEAAMYMRGWLLPLLEDYAWLISARRGDKFDYTSLFRTMREYEGASEIHDGAVEVFNLGGVEEGAIRRAIDEARTFSADVRLARRGLIEGFVG